MQLDVHSVSGALVKVDWEIRLKDLTDKRWKQRNVGTGADYKIPFTVSGVPDDWGSWEMSTNEKCQ